MLAAAALFLFLALASVVVPGDGKGCWAQDVIDARICFSKLNIRVRRWAQ